MRAFKYGFSPSACSISQVDELGLSSRQKHLSLGLIISAHATSHIYQLLLPLVLPKIAYEYSLNNFEAGLILAVFSASSSLFQTFFGVFSRRLGRKRLLCLGFVINSCAFAAIGQSRDMLSLNVLLFIAGIGWSTYHPLGIHFISDLYPEKRGEALGYHQAGGSMGSFVAPLLAGFLVESFGWRFSFLVLSSLGFAVGILLWLFLGEVPMEATGSSRPSLRNFVNPLILISAAMTYSIALRGVQSFATKYFQEGKGTSYFEATILYSALQVAGIVSGPFSGRLSDSVGRVKVIGALILIQSLSVFGLVVTKGSLLYFPCILYGFASFGLLATSDAFIVDVTARELVGAALGINLAASFAMSIVVPPLLGTSIDTRGFDTSFSIVSGVSMLSLLPLAWVALRRRGR